MRPMKHREPDHERFKRSLSLLIKKKHGSITKFSEQSGINRQTVYDYLNRTWPNSNKLIQLAKALEVTPEELLGVKLEAPKGTISQEQLYLIDATKDPDVLDFLLDCLGALRKARSAQKEME